MRGFFYGKFDRLLGPIFLTAADQRRFFHSTIEN